MIIFFKQIGKTRKLVLIAFIFIALLNVIIADDDDFDAPCAKPPFLTQQIMPNVLLILDTSGSMTYGSYNGRSNSSYGSLSYWSNENTQDYYGYADPNETYEYNHAGGYWEVSSSSTPAFDPVNGLINGNFYNYLFMRRIDVARKALIGGKVRGDRETDPHILVSQDYDGYWEGVPLDGSFDGISYYDNNNYAEMNIQWWNYDNYPHDCKWLFEMKNEKVYCYLPDHSWCRHQVTGHGGCGWRSWPEAVYNLHILPSPDYEAKGFVQKTADRVKYGLMLFNVSEGGKMEEYIGCHKDSLIKSIENCQIGSQTPLTEVLYEAYLMFTGQESCHNYIRPDDMTLWETYCGRSLWGGRYWVDYANHDPIVNWCEKNFVIYISDGAPTSDGTIPSWIKYYDGEGGATLADVSYYMHTNDLRSDFIGDQSVYYYGLYIFGSDESARNTLIDACKKGGFDDYNNNNWPDNQIEWDKDEDGLPDNYFEPQDGDELAIALEAAFQDILKRTSSASAVSVVSASTKGEGAVYQALFAPDKMIDFVNLGWVGTLRSFWIDQQGNLREDTDSDEVLHMIDDKIITVSFDGDNTVATRYRDIDGDGVHDGEINTVQSDSAKPVWDAGNLLHRRDPGNRNIYVGMPISSGSQKMDPMDFDTDNRDTLEFYLDVSGESADSLIEYIRGTDYPDYRNRTTDGDVWKLGDIIYATPVYVGPPTDRFDLIYNDDSYRQFFTAYYDRRGVVYQGANDGMLHAFNAGRYYESSDDIERGYIDDKGTYDLGEEMWAYIPHNILPHLQWLREPIYDDCHVFYLDNDIKAFDCKIWTSSSKHPQGWGTMLVASMRLGGSDYELSDGSTTQRSSLIGFDVTDPDDPELLWEWNDSDLGHTTVYPAIATVDDHWYLLYGNGPDDIDGDAIGNGKIYIHELGSDQLTQEKKFDMAGSEHMGDPLSLDINVDKNTDVFYIGSTIHDHIWQNLGGKVYRVNFFDSHEPDDWQVSTLIDIGRPVVSSGGATIDPFGNLWYFAGTGHYFSNFDEVDKNDNYFFGIKDEYVNTGSGEIYLSDLYDVTDIEVIVTDTGAIVQTPSGDMTFGELKHEIKQHKGWYVTFTSGERILAEPLVIGETVFFTTFLPNDDVCSFGGLSKLYGLNYMTGTASPELNVFGIEDLTYVKGVDLGDGVPTSPSAHIGVGEKATISTQLSTGEIDQQKASVATTKSGPIFWKGK
ncbi:MAG: pilus assembly protein [Candidatus Zixiibacteriota bacterium]